jgi:long-chain acyl-CoA synthetase
VFNRALNAKIANLHSKAQFSHAIWDRLVFNKIKNALGGQVRIMFIGSAPTPAETLDFMKCCFGCPVIEAYGQTETSGIVFVTNETDGSAGHVGGPLPSIKVKLRDVPDMDYTHKDLPYPRGEVMMKGPAVFTGYFKDPEKTAEAFDSEGWLCTGDVGMIKENGCLQLIDRAKNLFKLSQGEYIAPDKLQNVYMQHDLVA